MSIANLAMLKIPNRESKGGNKMKGTILFAALLAGLLAVPAQAQENELRIGFMTTLSGGGAVLGEEMKRGWDLGLEHQGWTEDGDELGGVPTRILIGDDQRAPDVALDVANRWLRSDRVHIVAGVAWSNVALAIRQQIIRNRAIFLITNAGAGPLAGELCSRYITSTSFNNDVNAEASGQLMNEDGLDSVYLMAPNYQAGKDIVAGFRRTYEGNIVGETLFRLGARDYQAEIAQVRNANPEALFIFAPGGMGVAFMRQWAASGMGENIKLYTVWTVDWLTLGPIGEAAVGSLHTNFWTPDIDRPATQRFVRAFIAAHGRPPSHFAAQGYDAPALIASAVRAVNGNVNDTTGMIRALRSADFESVRGEMSFNVNGIPIQNWYEREVVMGPDGPTISTTGLVFTNRADSYGQDCPQREHIQ